MAIASTKGRVTGDSGKSLRELQDESQTLREIIADVLLENARLKNPRSKKRVLQLHHNAVC
jgi:hypothetical protein